MSLPPSRRIRAACALAVASSAVFALAGPALAGDYTIDQAHSSIGFTVRHA
ncbi:YceI family protein, partial [Streptomyces sp. NPDC001919]